jgi:hypothetical protein
VLCVSVVIVLLEIIHHRDTEFTKIAQRLEVSYRPFRRLRLNYGLTVGDVLGEGDALGEAEGDAWGEAIGAGFLTGVPP